MPNRNKKKEIEVPLYSNEIVQRANYQNWINPPFLDAPNACILRSMQQFAFETFVSLAFPPFYDGEIPIQRHRRYLVTVEIQHGQ